MRLPSLVGIQNTLGWSLASNNLSVVRKDLEEQEEQGEDRVTPT